MKNNLKYLSAGLLLGAAIVIAMGAGAPPSHPVGRFQVAGFGANHAIMVDTSTGQAWHSMQDMQGFIKPKI